jgi:recombination protein RecT
MNSTDYNKQLASQIANNTGRNTSLAIQDKLETWKSKHFPKLMALCSNKTEAEKMYVVCMNTISRSPRLLECSFDSIATCILTSYQLKLFPGPMQECAFIPFGNVATFVPMYAGLLKLCYNSGFIKSIDVDVVWEGEEFEFTKGLETRLVHVPNLDIDVSKTQRKAVYCVIKTVYGDTQVTVLSPRFINGIKARSKGAKKPDSPWNGTVDDVSWMWKKTAVKQALKMIPRSADLQRVIEIDDETESDKPSQKPIIDLVNDDFGIAEERTEVVENETK